MRVSASGVVGVVAMISIVSSRAEQLPPEQRQNYEQQIKKSLEAPADVEQDSMVLEKEVIREADRDEVPLIQRLNWGLIIGLLLIIATIAFLASRRRHAHALEPGEL